MNNTQQLLNLFLGLLCSTNLLASSYQSPTIRLDFNWDDFLPRSGQVPDEVSNAPNTFNRANNGIDGSVTTRNNLRELAPQASKVTVTGAVKKFANVQSRGLDLSLWRHESDVEVKFWQPTEPSVIYSTRTDENGEYSIELANGSWQGEACGSAQGYNPNAWQVSVQDNQLVNLQERAYSVPQLTGEALDNTLQIAQSAFAQSASLYAASTLTRSAGETLTLNGQGFGCNGVLVFEFHNSVNQCGITSSVKYDHSKIIVADFIERSDTQIKIIMPSLMDTNSGDSQASQRIAKMYYQKAGQRSESIFVAEFLHEPLVEAVCNDTFAVPEPVNGVVGIPGKTPANLPSGSPNSTPTVSMIGSDFFGAGSIAQEVDLNLTINFDQVSLGGGF